MHKQPNYPTGLRMCQFSPLWTVMIVDAVCSHDRSIGRCCVSATACRLPLFATLIRAVARLLLLPIYLRFFCSSTRRRDGRTAFPALSFADLAHGQRIVLPRSEISDTLSNVADLQIAVAATHACRHRLADLLHHLTLFSFRREHVLD
jgi:hypothetical protein